MATPSLIDMISSQEDTNKLEKQGIMLYKTGKDKVLG